MTNLLNVIIQQDFKNNTEQLNEKLYLYKLIDWVEAKKNQDPLAPEKRPSQIRHVEITVAFHVLKGLAEQVKTSGENRHFMEFLRQEDTKYKVMICNYRFWRDFTEGVKDSSWIVNVVSHFLPAAEVKQN